VAGGRQAVAAARELAPQVVLLDLSGQDGQWLDLVRDLLDESPRSRIVALAPQAEPRLALEFLKTGASAFLILERLQQDLVPALAEVLANKIYLSPAFSDLVLKDYLEVLRESEAKFRTIFESATIGIAMLDLNGRLLNTSPALQEMLGYNRDEFHQMVFFRFAHPEDAAVSLGLFKELARGRRQSFQMDNRFLHKDGRLVWGRLTVSAVRGVNHSPFALAMMEDINERKLAEEEILVYQEKLHSLAAELALIEEQERRTLATDLHDHIGQSLALAQIKLGELRAATVDTPLAGVVSDIRQLVEHSIKSARSLTFELSPPILYDFGLEAAVEWFGEHLQEQYRLTVQVSKDGLPKPMSTETQVLLYKMFREVMLNAAKHAQANRVDVHLARQGDELHLTVSDDGQGFDPGFLEKHAPKHRSFGLFSVRERLRRIGGRLDIQSSKGQGATVTLVAPVWQERRP
jgi:PAS domain S-box-containing protein